MLKDFFLKLYVYYTYVCVENREDIFFFPYIYSLRFKKKPKEQMTKKN